MKMGKMRRVVTVVLALCVLLAFTLTGCAGSTTGNAPGKVTDLADREIELTKVPEKLISLTPSNTEILYALGLGSKVVAVDAISDYPAEVSALPKAGDYNGPNIEVIVGMEPDLVLAGNKLQKDAMAQLDAVNVPNAAVEAGEYAGIYDSIALVGKLTGAETAADKLIKEMKDREKKVTDAVAGAEQPTVYIIVSYGEFGNWTSGPGSFYNDLIKLAGGICVTDSIDPNAPWMQLDLEKILELDPDIILMADGVSTVEMLKAENGYKDMRAVKEGNVFVVDGDSLSRPGPRIIDALESMAKSLHPDKF